jgi:Bcr/CflA subfamily drug resistance transporter
MEKIKQNNFLIIIIVISIIALGNAGSTLYLPALIDIGHNIGASGSEMKISLACYLISFGVSQIFYGPLSDSYGRRVVLAVGLVIFLVGSVLSANATTIDGLFLGRVIEGFGIGAGNSVGLAIIRDLYSGDALSRLLGYVSIFVGMTPIIAPLIGGYLVDYLAWEACFWFLSIISVILLTMCLYFVPETNKNKDTSAANPMVAIKTYISLLKSREYVGYVMVTALGFSSIIVLNSMLPFLVINKLGVTPSHYGFVTVCTGVGYFTGAYLSGIISAKIGRVKTILLGIAIQMLVIATTFIMGFEELKLVDIILPLTITLCGIGLIVPTGTGGSMAPFPRIAGSEAALLGVGMYLFSSFFSAIGSKLSEDTQLSMFIMIYFIALLTLYFARVVDKAVNVKVKKK